MLRGEILAALAMLGNDETLNEASRRFHAFLEDRNTPLLPPDLRKVYGCEVHFYTGILELRPLFIRQLSAGSICRSYAESQLLSQIRL